MLTVAGNVVYANSQTNSDLFQVLKGGSNNFGIVMRLNLATFDSSNLWGGFVIYCNSTMTQQLQAMVNFNNNIQND